VLAFAVGAGADGCGAATAPIFAGSYAVRGKEEVPGRGEDVAEPAMPVTAAAAAAEAPAGASSALRLLLEEALLPPAALLRCASSAPSTSRTELQRVSRHSDVKF